MKKTSTIARTTRNYGLAYKKKLATTDSYLPRGAQGKLAVCES